MNTNIVTFDTKKIEEKYHVSSLMASILLFNDLNDEQIEDVLNGNETYHENNDPNLVACCKRIIEAKNKKEKIFILGDYDADGICATSIMKNTLDKLQITNGYYIPDRFKDGYGISPKIVELAHQKGYSLIITVDNGVKAYEAIDKVKELGMDIIVTDHHIIEKPLDVITVHPSYMDEVFHGMCGAGVALQVARKLIGEDDLNDVLAMIATIGDMMLLFNENRRIVKKGLRKVSNYPSVTKLLGKDSGIKAEDISFYFVPKINAIGRLKDNSNSNVLVKYLLSKDIRQIDSCALQINDKNELRKSLSNEMAVNAEKLINPDDKMIIVFDENFEEGMVGLVAGKLAKKYHKPAIVFSKGENGILKASGRSVQGYDLHAFFEHYDLETFGGHAQAIGFSIKEEDYEDFKAIILDEAMDEDIVEESDKALRITLNDINVKAVNDLRVLEPFGMGLKYPEFYINDLTVKNVRLLKDKYLKFDFGVCEGICFNTSLKQITNPKAVIGTLSINQFNRQLNVSINIKDME